MFRSRAVPPCCKAGQLSTALLALVFLVALIRLLGVQVLGCAASLKDRSAEHSYELGGSALFFDVALIRFLGVQIMGCAATL